MEREDCSQFREIRCRDERVKALWIRNGKSGRENIRPTFPMDLYLACKNFSSAYHSYGRPSDSRDGYGRGKELEPQPISLTLLFNI